MGRLLAGKILTADIEAGSADWLTRHPQIRTASGRGCDIRVPTAQRRRERARWCCIPGARSRRRHLSPLSAGELRALVRRTLRAARLAEAPSPRSSP